MHMKFVRQILIPIVLIALIISIISTYISIKSKPAAEPKIVSLNVLPQYTITSGKDLIIWPGGTVFEQGMAAYFYAAMPQVIITPVIKISGLDQGLVSGTIRSMVVVQSVDDKSRTYWSYTLNDTPAQKFTLSQGVSGQADMLNFTAPEVILDVPAAYEMASRIGNELMFQAGTFQLVVHSNINIDGTVNGIPVQKDFVNSLPLTLQQVSFSIPKSQDAASEVLLRGDEYSAKSQRPLLEAVYTNLLPISINMALLVLLLILVLMGNMDKSKAAIEHRRFKEWITEGRVQVNDKFKINILSLEGLVDLAIDLDKRVIFDPKENKYYVLEENIVYIYDSENSSDVLDSRQQLGKLLLERELIKPEQLEIGLHYQRKIGRRLGESLIALGFIDETTLYSTLAGQQGIDYYEIDTSMEITDTSWLDKMSIQKAKALMALPLGVRGDGKLVIACSEVSGESIREALEEIFGTEIKVVASRPSAIYETLERIDALKKLGVSDSNLMGNDRTGLFQPIEEEEREKFIASYYRGKILHELLLKASGLIESAVLNQVRGQESPLGWLASRNVINGETVSLIKGMDRAIEAMDWHTRQKKQLPELIDLLSKANYITSETLEWINRETAVQGLSINQLLLRNFIVSEDTLKKASLLLDALESIIV